MFKKSLGLLLSAILVAMLAACGSGNNNAQNTGGSSPSGKAPASGAAAEGDAVEITFWDMAWGPAEYMDTAEKLVEKFNGEHPKIKVKYQSIPWDNNWYQTFTNAIASGSPPDISTGAGYQAFQFYDKAEILPIDDVIEQWRTEGKLDDFLDNTVDFLKYDGHYIALPWQTDARVPFYRKDLFEKAGITTLPTTWEELRADLKKLSTDGNYGMVVSGGDTLGLHVLLNTLINNGGGLFTADKKVDIKNARNVEALTYISDLVKDGSINPASTGFTRADAEKNFGTGQSAVIIDAVGIMDNLPDIKDKIGILPPLAGLHGDKQAVGWVNNIMIYKQSKHPEQSKEFLKWWSENQLTLWTEGKASGFPARKSFSQDAFFQGDEIRKAITESYLPIAKMSSNQYASGFPELNEIEGDGSLLKLIQQVLFNKPLDSSLNEAEQKLKEIMKQ